MKTKTFMLAFLVLLTGCSLKSRDKGTDAQAMVKDSNEFEFAVDNVDDVLNENSGDETVALDSSATNPEKNTDEFLNEVGNQPEEPKFEEFKVAEKAEVKEVKIETPLTPLMLDNREEDEPAFAEFSEEFQSYQVQSGDTLMMIGFKLFGDYRKWKELKEWNHLSSMELRKGMMIKYRPMLNDKFVWRPTGEAHLVKKGEYLGSISYDKYGTSRRWKEIFDNNRPLLRNPNLVFAGFTIYYVPDKRSVASEK